MFSDRRLSILRGCPSRGSQRVRTRHPTLLIVPCRRASWLPCPDPPAEPSNPPHLQPSRRIGREQKLPALTRGGAPSLRPIVWEEYFVTTSCCYCVRSFNVWIRVSMPWTTGMALARAFFSVCPRKAFITTRTAATLSPLLSCSGNVSMTAPLPLP